MPKKSAAERHLARFSELCLALPGATRELTGRHATFRVRGKVFAYFLDDHHGDGILAACFRTTRGEHLDWVRANPERFFLPAYIGPRGWVGFRLDRGRVSWSEVSSLLRDSYHLSAPASLSKRLGG